jgi:MFS family permease
LSGRSVILRINFASLLFDGSFYVVMTAVALRAIDLEASPIQLGLLPVLSSGCYVLAALLLGRLSDRWRRFAMARFGATVRAAAILGVIGANDPVALLCWMPILGASNGFFWPGLQSVLGALSERDRLSRVLGGFNVAWSTGKMLGFFLGGFFLERAGHAPVLVAASAVTFAIVLVLPWREVPHTHGEGQTGDESRLSPVPRTLAPATAALVEAAAGSDADAPRSAKAGPALAWSMWRQVGWAANFLLFGLGATLNFHYPKYLDEHGMGGGAIFGTFLGIVYLSQTLFFVIAGLWHRWPFRLAPLVVTQLSCAAGIATLLWLRSPLAIWAVAPLVGIGLGFAYASSIFYSLHGTSERGHSTGIHEALLGSGSFLMPFVGGLLVDVSGSLAAPYVLLVGALLSLIGFEVWRVGRLSGATLPEFRPR